MNSVKIFAFKFSNYSEEIVHYLDEVKVYLVTFTNSNAFGKKHEAIKIKAA